MRYSVLEEFIGALDETQLLIKGAGVGLRLYFYSIGLQTLLGDLYALAHKNCADAAAAFGGNNTPDSCRIKGESGRQHAQVGNNPAVLTEINVPSSFVLVVKLGVRAVLLHYEYVHAQLQYFIKLGNGKVFKFFCCKFHANASYGYFTTDGKAVQYYIMYGSHTKSLLNRKNFDCQTASGVVH